jgi:hypothetical protein
MVTSHWRRNKVTKSKLFGRITKGIDKRSAERGDQNIVIKKWQKMTERRSDDDLIHVFDTLYRKRKLKEGDDSAKNSFIQSFNESFRNPESSIYQYFM